SILISSGFVNSNYQIKKVLFSKNTFKVRVPKQYVNPNIQYYLKMKKVEWKSKTHSQYFYTKTEILPSQFYIRNQPEFFNFTPNCYLPNTDTFKRKPRNMLWWI